MLLAMVFTDIVFYAHIGKTLISVKRQGVNMQEQLAKLGERFSRIKEQLQTEEATKHSLVIPFFMALGYDPFDPAQIVPEFISDFGTKKGEKIDYAIMKDGKPAILVECKHWTEDLNNHSGQLFRYFSTQTAKFALLTNGVKYMFFTDIDKPNKLDEKPFFEFDITCLRDEQVNEINKLHRKSFDPDTLASAASDLKYTGDLKTIITSEIKSPSDDLVRHFTRQVFDGKITERQLAYFKDIVRKSFQEVISETVSNRLTSALNAEKEIVAAKVQQEVPAEPEKSAIETTQQEIDGFNIVRAICSKVVKPERIAIRDNQSYCNVLLDDNIRKQICRLHFNNSEKLRVQILGPGVKGDRNLEVDINSPEDLFGFADQILKAVHDYDNPEN